MVQREKRFINKTYNGVIYKQSDGSKGSFFVTVRDTTLHLGLFEHKIRDYIKVGDSISKEKGTAAIKVYRKDKDSIWQEKVFK
ncbi:MAG: hypothetical protein HXX09_03445 [Bacteroidetes bacterium]|nr:hypothetical protein [Bacteroidota bacterium]